MFIQKGLQYHFRPTPKSVILRQPQANILLLLVLLRCAESYWQYFGINILQYEALSVQNMNIYDENWGV